MKKKNVFLGCGILVAAAAMVSAYTGHSLLGHQFKNESTAYIYIDKDDNTDSVRAKIIREASPSSLVGFDMATSAYKLDKNLRTGRYAIAPDASMLDIIRNIRNHHQAPIMLVIPSVRTVEDLAGRIGDKLLIDSTDIASALKDRNVCESLGYTTATIPALFIPNTYEVWWDMSVEDFLSRMKKENNAFWNAERTKKAEKAGMTKEEVVTLASIVDEETANNAEKPRIAGLYINRLRMNMPLQSDPTVKYALGDFALRRILNVHLNVESPYNTYRVEGLPPGPIRIPSIAGIDAVLNHESHNYLYMCAKEDFSGTHNFAETYNQHLANARRYTAALNARGIR
ncbi:MAG: endolytic transglycosylase MltG [Bacteroides sp.]|nr:endolytic transglycosylase MltG [Roseburia sp.]MCM1347292.1 endolytic transglycosylase MltG [Bacteroides sp.]MCM1421771.1 endolytic transglycosylase MltG [Bacteroides sp.]